MRCGLPDAESLMEIAREVEKNFGEMQNTFRR